MRRDDIDEIRGRGRGGAQAQFDDAAIEYIAG